MIQLKEIRESLLQIIFPHICSGCGSDLLSVESNLCLRCVDALPETDFEKHENNPVEKIFWGRLPLESASASYYFTKESLVQHLMHQFKYKSNKELGLQLGRMMGYQLLYSERFKVDAIVPLPLFPGKEKRRGYNQSVLLCEGIAELLKVPVLTDVIIRPEHTETQTKKGRIERWRNMEGKFLLTNREKVAGKHLLLVDDVVTTGATLEACGTELLKVDKVKLSIATLCFASRI
jgi:ComF family protein